MNVISKIQKREKRIYSKIKRKFGSTNSINTENKVFVAKKRILQNFQ
jgi:hypothetical protein